MKYLIYTLIALFVILVILIWSGWGDKAYDALKKSLAEQELKENAENKAKIEALELRENALVDRLRQKDAEIATVTKRLIDKEKVIKDLQLKLAQVTVPSNPDEIVLEFRKLGYKSFGRKR